MVSRPNSRQNKTKPKAAKSDGFIRIIGGIWKGKKLKVRDSEGLRPTTDRIKETLFNWLMFEISDRKVLDCYTGSGWLGFEALSRGAQSVDLVELDKTVAKQLAQNIHTLAAVDSASRIKLHNISCLDFISQTKQQFDLVFIDPPFHKNLVEPTIHLIEQQDSLLDGALIYLETEKEALIHSMIARSWQLMKEKITGQVCYRLFRFKAE